MKVRNCHRCGLELTNPKDQKTVNFGYEYRVLCPTCFGMTLAFCTPAFIPGISKTQYDLLVHKAKNIHSESEVFGEFVNEIKRMREEGFTIPEIAQTAKVTNRVVMEILKK